MSVQAGAILYCIVFRRQIVLLASFRVDFDRMEEEGKKQRLLPARPVSAQHDNPSAPRLGSITGRSSWKVQAKRPPTTEVSLPFWVKLFQLTSVAKVSEGNLDVLCAAGLSIPQKQRWQCSGLRTSHGQHHCKHQWQVAIASTC